MPYIIIAIIIIALIVFYVVSNRSKSADESGNSNISNNVANDIDKDGNIENDNEISEDELIAIFTTCIMEYTGHKTASKFIVKSYKRLPETSSVWNAESRVNALNNAI